MTPARCHCDWSIVSAATTVQPVVHFAPMRGVAPATPTRPAPEKVTFTRRVEKHSCGQCWTSQITTGRLCRKHDPFRDPPPIPLGALAFIVPSPPLMRSSYPDAWWWRR